MPPAMPPAVQSAVRAVLQRPPQPAHTGLTRMPQLMQRARVCARACACRRYCRSRRWPAGKLCDCPQHELDQAVRGTWVVDTHRYCEGLACSVTLWCESRVNLPNTSNCGTSPSCSVPCSVQMPPVLPAVWDNAKHSPRRSHAAAQSGSVSKAAPCTTGVQVLLVYELVVLRVPVDAGWGTLRGPDAGAHRLIGEMGGQRGAAADARAAADEGVRVHCTGSPSTVAIAVRPSRDPSVFTHTRVPFMVQCGSPHLAY
jgi:hypothetical protein